MDLDQYYLKVRLRRAQAYEAEEKLEEAFEGEFSFICMMLPDQMYNYIFIRLPFLLNCLKYLVSNWELSDYKRVLEQDRTCKTAGDAVRVISINPLFLRAYVSLNLSWFQTSLWNF